MKRTLAIAFLLAATLHAGAQQAALSTEAQRAYISGDLETAKHKFKLVLDLDPGNVAARNYLRMIAASEAKAGSGAKKEKELQRLFIPLVELKEASLEAWLTYLQKQAGKASNGKVQVSFVMQPGVNRETPISMRLVNIPFSEVLYELGELAGVQFVVEAYAISVRPKPANMPKPVTGAAAQ